MLFNSFVFLFVYLPIVFIGFIQLGRINRSLSAAWLFLSSLFFYGWWNPAYVGLLLASIAFNYAIGVFLAKMQATGNVRRAKLILWFGVSLDLCLLGYYKYANFFVKNLDAALGLGWGIEEIALPIGISFFTFTQIAFLVDAYRGEVKEANFIHYGLFVTYFPHLIAGPILHHKEMMPQFSDPATYKANWENISVGLTIFVIGLFKKVVFADGIAPFSNPVFAAAAHGEALSFVEAWGGALAYTFQLYFDFSGYSDMAIGLSRMFGVKLPLNFDSPYKSVNIIEFWRRWHMTLSRFLRDYLYIGLGGNRKGISRRYINLMLTMVLGGLWHGAGWTFMVWGGLHGFYLVINHGWQRMRKALGHDVNGYGSMTGRMVSVTLTFFVVVIAWVFFRAQDIDAALNILHGMAGANGFVFPSGLLPGALTSVLAKMGVIFGELHVFSEISARGGALLLIWIACLWFVVWFVPNSQQIMARFKPVLEKVVYEGRIYWRPNRICMAMTIVVLIYTFTEMGKVSEFLYFQF